MKSTFRSLALTTIGVFALGIGAAAAQTQQGAQKNDKATGRKQAAQNQNPVVPVAATAEIIATTGTVQSVDKEKRTLVLKDEAGDEIRIQVAEDVAGFDRLKKGDRIDVTYSESVAVALLPPGSAQPTGEERRRIEGQRAGGGVFGREVVVTAEIIGVDNRNKAIEVKLPNGQTHTVSVRDPELQRQLKDLKPGHMLVVDYTEAMATSIAPAAPRGKR